MPRHDRPLRIGLATLMLYVGLVSGATRAGAEDTPATIIDQVLQAYGGWGKLSAVTGYSLTGVVLTSHAKPPVQTSRAFQRPCRLRIELAYADGKEVRVVDGETGWRAGTNGLAAKAEGPLLDSMRLQCARSALPWILQENRDAVRFAETLEGPARKLRGLELSLGEHLTLRAFVDPGSGRILRALTVLDGPAMKIAFETRYSEFSKMDGVLFARREENYTGGKHTASTTIGTLELNPAFGEDVFGSTAAEPADGADR